MPKIHAYLRCSGERQAAEGHTIDAQLESTARYAKLLIDQNPDLSWTSGRYPHNMPAGFYVDLAVSAYKTPLTSRKAFTHLLQGAGDGDQIIVSRLDRAFRNVQDFANSIVLLAERGISIHFAEQQINFGTANGRAMAQMLAVFAEWESAMRSERLRACWKVRQLKEGQVKEKRRPRSVRRIYRVEDVSVPGSFRARIRHTGEPVSVGTVYGYVRISHWDGVKSGLGIEAQRRSEAAYRSFLKSKPQFSGLIDGEVFNDEAVSAWKEAMRDREQGSRLDQILKAGDHVIFGRLDRAFRSMKDFALTHENWRQRGITMHFADQQLDMGSATGIAMGGLLSVFAQWESMAKSERTKAALYSLRHRGLRMSFNSPKYTKWIPTSRGKVVVPNREQMVVAKYAWHMRTRGLTYGEISDRIEAMLSKREGREPIPRNGYWFSRPGTKTKRIARRYRVDWLRLTMFEMRRKIAIYGDPFVAWQMPPEHCLSPERRAKKPYA